MKLNKALNLLGLATKAGKLLSGEFQTEKAVKEGKAQLVIVASDASQNTKKMFVNMCEFYKVPVLIWGTKEEIGAAIGKETRASAALLDPGFRDAFIRQTENERSREEM